MCVTVASPNKIVGGWELGDDYQGGKDEIHLDGCGTSGGRQSSTHGVGWITYPSSQALTKLEVVGQFG